VGEELDYAAELINKVIERVGGLPGAPRIGLHVCRGNWSTREEVLLTGDYRPLLPAFERMRVDQYVLEYATPRAGEIDVVGRALSGPVPGSKRLRELGLGVVNPRTTEVETPEEIVVRAESALRFFSPERLFLNTDCGFGCFASRSVNVEEVAAAKIGSIARAARLLRERHG
jgi:5-methyltetrahydropteroyltriglutamate--homocysteine methyltransferase